MPSSKQKRSKDLHLANCVGDLNKLSDLGIQTGREGNAKLFCKSADKVFLKAEEHDLDGDEEQAYVFYMRYFNIISLIKKTKQYQDDKKYYHDLLGQAKAKRAVSRAEILQQSLQERYDKLKAEQEEEAKAQEIAKKKEQEIEKQKSEKKPDNNARGNTTDSNIAGDDLDDLLNGGHAISSSSDVYQRLRVNHSAPLTPQSSGSVPNGDLLPSLVSSGSTQTAPSISAQKLYSLTQTVSPSALLILDTRSKMEYAECRIQHRSCISIPQEMIDQGVSVGSIERRLPERTRVMWRERSKKQVIVILDKSTKAADVTPTSKIQCLKDAIFKYDSFSALQKEPLFLDGGFDSWLWHYPSLNTNPQLPKISSGISKTVTTDLSSLDYPELPGYEDTALPVAPSQDDTPGMVNSTTLFPQPGSNPANQDRNNTSAHVAETIPNSGISPLPSPSPINPSQDQASPYFEITKVPVARPQDSAKDQNASSSVTDLGVTDINRATASVTPSTSVSPAGSIKPSGGVVTPSKPVTNDRTINPSGAELPAVVSTPPTAVTPAGAVTPPAPSLTGVTQSPMIYPAIAQSAGNVPVVSQAHSSITTPSSTAVPHTAQPQTPSNIPPSTTLPLAPAVSPAAAPQSVVSQAQKPTSASTTVHHVPPRPSDGSGATSGALPTSSKQLDNHGLVPSSVSAPSQLPKQRPPSMKAATYTTTPGLPTGWEKVKDPNSSRVYYKDHNTQTTHWTVPRSVGTPVAAARSGILPSARPPAVGPQQGGSGAEPNKQTQKLQQARKEVHKPEDKLLESKKSGLRRSLSSPNLAKLAQDGDLAQELSRPSFDRSAKPADKVRSEISRPRVNRGMKPLSMQTLDSLSPVHGGSGAGLTGLRNLGNTCYMNSVIQCLSGMAPLAAYFISGAYVDDLNKSNRMGTRGELCEQFSVLVRVLHSGQFRYVSPTTFKKTVGRFKSDFAGFDQQDSQELLSFLMEALHEDTNRVLKKPMVKPPADNLSAHEAAEVAWNNHKLRNQSLMVELFDGLFKSTVRCLTCQKESVTFETFSNLTLPLPPQTNSCSLEDCVKLFTKPEKMAGDDKWRCPSCKVYRDASKRIQIWRLPPILIVHLKRFQYEGMWRQKLQTGVNCPLHNLQLTGHVVGPNSNRTYHLYAVSNHYGTMHGGHYTAFCRSVYADQWYKFDDQFVSRMAAKDVMTSAAYLLFYTSIDFVPPKILL